MRGHQVRHEVLFLANRLGDLVKPLLEGAVCFDVGLAHMVEHIGGTMFGSDFELPAHMMGNQFPEEGFIGILHEVIVPDARPDKDLFHLGKLAQFPEQAEVFAVIDF